MKIIHNFFILFVINLGFQMVILLLNCKIFKHLHSASLYLVVQLIPFLLRFKIIKGKIPVVVVVNYHYFENLGCLFPLSNQRMKTQTPVFFSLPHSLISRNYHLRVISSCFHSRSYHYYCLRCYFSSNYSAEFSRYLHLHHRHH